MQDFLMNSLPDRLDVLLERIANAAGRSGREDSDITLVAVTKTQPPEVLRLALDAGLSIFGENRVQEMTVKAAELPSSIHWHMIGHLQSNKVRKALTVSELIHGVDTVALAMDIERIAEEMGLFPRVLLEVNVAGESSKFGFREDTLLPNMEKLLSLRRVSVEGLMTVAPSVEKPEDARPFFQKLRNLRDRCEADFRVKLPILSMGMSGDFEAAIEEGATHIRVGSAIFGART